jgi:hypothetical protein
VHLVCDNQVMPKTPAMRDWPALVTASACISLRQSRWITQVEPWFGFLASQMICRGVYESVQSLGKEARPLDEAVPRPSFEAIVLKGPRRPGRQPPA